MIKRIQCEYFSTGRNVNDILIFSPDDSGDHSGLEA